MTCAWKLLGDGQWKGRCATSTIQIRVSLNIRVDCTWPTNASPYMCAFFILMKGTSDLVVFMFDYTKVYSNWIIFLVSWKLFKWLYVLGIQIIILHLFIFFSHLWFSFKFLNESQKIFYQNILLFLYISFTTIYLTSNLSV